MKSSATLLFAAALGVGMVGREHDARALGPVDLEVGAKVGAGGNPFSAQPNPLGFGLGARAGLAFLGGWYGGLSLMYYFGESGTVDMPPAVPASERAVLYGVEAGYGISFLNLLTIRGQVGAGSFNLNYTGSGQVGFSNLYLEPGLTALVSLGLLFVGADVNLLILPGVGDPAFPTKPTTWATALTAHGQVGVKF